MIGKFSLFTRCILFPFLNLLPQRRQQLADALAEVCQELPMDFCCVDILECWAEGFGFEGWILGNLSLFLAGALVMILGEVFCRRGGSFPALTASLEALYSLVKFRSRDSRLNVLILLFSFFWLVSGFSWVLAFAWLVVLTNFQARFHRGGEVSC